MDSYGAAAILPEWETCLMTKTLHLQCQPLRKESVLHVDVLGFVKSPGMHGFYDFAMWLTARQCAIEPVAFTLTRQGRHAKPVRSCFFPVVSVCTPLVFW